MKKRTTIIITLSAFLLIGGVAACKHGHHFGGLDKFDLAAVTGRIASRLDLTESQKADLDQMAWEIAGKAKAMHAGHENRQQELADLIRQEVISKEVVDDRITEKLEKIRDIADFAADRLIAFHLTLTPEQRESLAVHIENRSSNGCRFGWR